MNFSKPYLLLMILLSVFFSQKAVCAPGKDGYSAELTEFDYPYPVKYLPIKSQQQDLTMAYMYEKPKTASKGVYLLFHGKNFSGFYWKNVADFLLEKGYSVLIPDQIGFGKSSKPKQYAYSFHTLARHTQALLDTLSVTEVSVIGHSMGGMLAARFSLSYPSHVNKLILVNPIGLEDYSYYTQAKDADFFFTIEKKKSIEKIMAYQRKNYYDGQWNAQYESLTDIHRGWIQGPDWERVAWNNALMYGPIFHEPFIHEIDKLKTTLHLIIGTRDKTGPGRKWKKPGINYTLGQYDKLGKQLLKKYPNHINLYELDGLGHLPQYEDFARFSKALTEAMK